MKKILTLIAGLLIATSLSWAVRAPRAVYTYTQPDGSVITLMNHGDEFHHWTTHNGVLVEMDEQGFYRPASRMVFDSQASSAQASRRQANVLRRAAANAPVSGEKHYLVLLIEFDDLSFSIPDPHGAFEKMLNEPGYHEYGGTGSARDYFIDNSSGLFRPVFDVYGPIRVSKNYAYYGEKQDMKVHEALEEACAQLDERLDFSQYDHDGDGYVDNIFFFFAGYNEAQGGGVNTIWPHQGFSPSGMFDGVEIWKYACTSEFYGNKGANIAGIGFFVHEFSHVLGLPDFYDVSNDKAENPEQFSVMSDGHHLNNGRTPASLNSLERQMLGWMGTFPRLSDAGNYELESLSGNHLPWVLPADVDGELFILEMRDGKGWDAALPKGMVIYHMDASSNSIGNYRTAASVWDGTVSAPINDYYEHPCFYVVASLEYGRGKAESMIFPGIGNITDFTPIPWSGYALPTRIRDINLIGDRVQFSLTADVRRMMTGTVKDPQGSPIEGATVTLSLPVPSSSQGRSVHLSRAAAADIRYTAMTGADGSYAIFLGKEDETRAFFVSASKPGYVEQGREVPVDIYGHGDFILRPAGAPSRVGLMNYDPDNQEPFASMGWGDTSYQDGILAVTYFPASELAAYAGMEVRSISFCINADKVDALYALVYEGDRLLLAPKVEGSSVNGYYTVDLSAASLKVLGNKGMYFGYAIEGHNPDPVVYQTRKGVKNGSYYSSFDMERPFWQQLADGALIVSVALYDPTASQYVTLANMGFSSIDNPRWKEGYAAGDTFPFHLLAAEGKEVESVEWLYDGAKTANPSVTLKAGKHVVVARVRYRDNSQEELTLELTVR